MKNKETKSNEERATIVNSVGYNTPSIYVETKT